MKIKTLLAASLLLAGGSAFADGSKLQLKVITSSQPGFWVNSTLISGEKDAVLIDAQFTLSDAHRLAAEILESGKNLTTIYITHFHPDHYFGLSVLTNAFPNAKVVALPATVQDIKGSWSDKVKTWKPMYGDNLPSNPVVPEALTGSTLTLEGETLRIVGGVQGDAENSSYVWIPSLKAVVCGDIVYSGIFPWTRETDPTQRKSWIKTLDKIAALKPEIVVAGHKNPVLRDDASAIGATRDYLLFFDKARASSKSAEELAAKVKAQYPGLAMDIILKMGSEAAFLPSQKK